MIENLAASVHQRLLNRAREEGRPFNELLQHFALRRFLYRLGQSPHRDTFVLKGALMLPVWRVPLPRPTRDIDLLGRTDRAVENLVRIVQEICAQPAPDDGLDFDPDSVVGERIIEAAEYGGVRVRFDGHLGNARVPMQIDVGFGDKVVPDPTLIRLPAILEFPPAELQGYSRESAVAEKVHTMVRLGEINSRMKDFFDIWLLATRGSFEGGVLAKAVQATFRQRTTPIPASPVALSDAFGRDRERQVQWAAFLRRYRLRDIAGIPSTLLEVVRLMAAFLSPVLEAASQDLPFDRQWSPGGPWRTSG